VRDWTGHLVVLGLGASGRAAAEWGLSRAHEGVRVTVLDSGAGDALAGCAASLRDRGAEVRLGVDHVEGADIVVASPGIRPTAPLMVRLTRRSVTPLAPTGSARAREPWSSTSITAVSPTTCRANTFAFSAA